MTLSIADMSADTGMTGSGVIVMNGAVVMTTVDRMIDAVVTSVADLTTGADVTSAVVRMTGAVVMSAVVRMTDGVQTMTGGDLAFQEDVVTTKQGALRGSLFVDA